MVAAERIINDYGAVLEVSSKLGSLSPESLLPHSKERIRAAYWTYLVGLYALGQLEPETLGILKAGYMCLANFVSAKKAASAALAMGVMKSGDVERAVALGPDPLGLQEWAREQERLQKEFDRLVSKLPEVPFDDSRKT
jgi:hypothetical protein